MNWKIQLYDSAPETDADAVDCQITLQEEVPGITPKSKPHRGPDNTRKGKRPSTKTSADAASLRKPSPPVS